MCVCVLAACLPIVCVCVCVCKRIRQRLLFTSANLSPRRGPPPLFSSLSALSGLLLLLLHHRDGHATPSSPAYRTTLCHRPLQKAFVTSRIVVLHQHWIAIHVLSRAIITANMKCKGPTFFFKSKPFGPAD